MQFVVIVTIDKRGWEKSKSYYSDLFDTEAEVNTFLEQVNEDFPDNSMRDFKYDHEWRIRHMRFRVEHPTELEAIKEVAKAYKHYSEAKGECVL